MLYLCIVLEQKRPLGRLSKFQIAQLFGLVNLKSSTYNSRELRSGYFTDEVLELLGLDAETYRKIRRFTYKQSLLIVEIFQFDNDDLNQIGMSAMFVRTQTVGAKHSSLTGQSEHK